MSTIAPSFRIVDQRELSFKFFICAYAWTLCIDEFILTAELSHFQAPNPRFISDYETYKFFGDKSEAIFFISPLH